MAKKNFYNNANKQTVSQFSGMNGVEAKGVIDPSSNDAALAPMRVIPTAQAALAIYRNLRDRNLKRIGGYQKIQGMLDGNPPYNPARMMKEGLSDMCNVNWKDGEALYRQAVLAYWSLFNQVEFIADFKVTLDEPKEMAMGEGSGYTPEGRKAASVMNAELGKIISEEWNNVIRSWPSFNKRMNFHQGELLKFGLNAIIWPDERDWRFKPVSVKNFIVPDNTENDMEMIDLICIENTYSARYLWEVYDSLSDGDNGVWNKKVLGDLLVRLANISDVNAYRTDRVDPLWLQSELKQGNLYFDALYNDDIRLVSIFVKEYDDGAFSHIMIHPSLSTDDFVYFNYKQYKNLREAFTYFTFSPGESMLHSNKGLGHSIYAAVEAITRLDCSLLDQAIRSGSLLLRSNPGRGADDRSVKFVPGGIIDLGECEVAQNTLGSNVQNIAETSRYFKQKILENNNISGFDSSTQDKDYQSAFTMQYQASREARVQRNVIAHYYDGLDRFFREIVRKMLLSKPSYPGYEYVKTWKENCIARGVPKEVFEIGDNVTPDGLPRHLQVSATRSAGSGSQTADIMEMQLVMNLLPQLGQRGRQAAMEDYIAAARGWRYKDRYLPMEDQDNQPTGHDTIASLENNQLSDGKQVIVSSDNNHLVHATNHMRMMVEWMEMYQQDPQAMYEDTTLLQKEYQIFSVAGPHFVKHLMILSQDPTMKAQYEQLNAQWAQVANFGDMIANNAIKQQQAQMAQQQEAQMLQQQYEQQNTPEQIKARGSVMAKEMKTKADIELDRYKERYKYLLEAEKLRNKDDIDRAKAAVELANEARRDAIAQREKSRENLNKNNGE